MPFVIFSRQRIGLTKPFDHHVIQGDLRFWDAERLAALFAPSFSSRPFGPQAIRRSARLAAHFNTVITVIQNRHLPRDQLADHGFARQPSGTMQPPFPILIGKLNEPPDRTR